MILWRVSKNERRRCKPGTDRPGDLSGKRTGRISFLFILIALAKSLESDPEYFVFAGTAFLFTHYMHVKTKREVKQNGSINKCISSNR